MKPPSARERLAALCVTSGFLLGVLLGHNDTGRAADMPAPKIIVVEKVRTLGAKDFARSLLSAKSYACLEVLLTRESNWRPRVLNRDSGASGIGQLLPETWRNLGMKPSKDANSQLVATIAYLARRYGSGGACSALKFHNAHNWY
jgi:hypothetical protein